MSQLLISCAIAAAVLAIQLVGVSATCVVCPQAVPEDTSAVFCASSSNYGQRNMTNSVLANWNCNQPLNKYTKISDSPCAPGPDTLSTCGENECDPSDTTQVCAKLNQAATVALFANKCELAYYNCRFPNRQYTRNFILPAFCVSAGI